MSGVENERERHEYNRHVFRLLVQWYTVFFAVNVLSMVWLSMTTPHRDRLGVIAVFLALQCLIATLACTAVSGRLTNTSDSAVPSVVYRRTTGLMGLGLFAMALTWIFFAAIGWFRAKHQTSDADSKLLDGPESRLRHAAVKTAQ